MLAGQPRWESRLRQRRIVVATWAVVAAVSPISPRGATAQETALTPRTLLHHQVDAAETLDRTGRGGQSTTLAGQVRLRSPARYLCAGDPDQAVDLQQISEHRRGEGEMPLRWDPAAGRFVLLPLQLSNYTSAAQVRFTWYFLRAYARLAPDLRKSGSTLAVGAAATVAADIVYPSNGACLPVETREAAAIFSLLDLHLREDDAPRLLDACLEQQPVNRRSLVRAAVEAMNRRARGPSAPGPAAVDLDWLDTAPLTHARAGRPVSLAELLPHDPEAVEILVQLAEKRVANLTIRARIMAAACPRLEAASGVGTGRESPETGDRAARWRRRLDALVDAVHAELAIRDREINQDQARGPVIVPRFEPGEQPGMRLRSDPAVLEPLLVVAGRLANRRLREAREGGLKVFLEALKSEPPTQRVLALAGVEPVVEFHRIREPGAEAHLARLLWNGLERFVQKDVARPEESVQVDLIDDRPAGQGRAVGIGADHRLVVLEPGGQGRKTLRPTSRVRSGDMVLGYTPMELPARQGIFRVRADLQEAWFRVLDARRSSRAANVELRLADGSRLLLGEEHRVLQSLGTSAIWQKAAELRSGSILWRIPSSSGPGIEASLAGTIPVGSPEPMVELSLSWPEERGRANNLVVLPPGPEGGDAVAALVRGPAVLAEARSIDQGPIAPDELVQTVDQSGRKTEVRADRLVAAAAQPGVIAGYHVPSRDDPWREPPFVSEHRARVLARETVEVREAVRLVFENDSSVLLGPGNWVLLRGKENVPVERPVASVREGDELISGVTSTTLTTLRLRKVEPVGGASGEVLRFVKLKVQNLTWARVGPILVSLEGESREDEKSAEGVAETTTFAARASDGTVKYGLVPDPLPARWGVAIVDGSRFEVSREAAIAAGVRSRTTSRTVVVEARAEKVPGGGQPQETHRRLECAPGQALLVFRRADDGKAPSGTLNPLIIPAGGDLRPGDSLAVFGPGGTIAYWPVAHRRLRFHEPPVSVQSLEVQRRARFYEGAQAILLVNQGLCVVHGAPGQAETPAGRAARSAAGPGEKSGSAPGTIINQGSPVPDRSQGVVARLAPGATEDRIEFPVAALPGLRNFGPAMQAMVEAESHRLHPPAEADAPLLRYWEAQFSDQNLRWPYGTADIGTELRIWTSALVQRRARFLDQPRSVTLPPILLQEMVLASWLRAAGSTQLSERILADMIELVIFAGCEPDRERARLGSHLGLPLVLYAPGFIRGHQPARVAEAISLPAQQRLREWSGGAGVSLLDNGKVLLSVLYGLWFDRAEALGLADNNIPQFWKPITTSSGGASRGGAEAAGRAAFDTWVRRQVPALSKQLSGEPPP